jgi:hypothetical protein
MTYIWGLIHYTPSPAYTVIVIGTENEFFEVNDIFLGSATELDGAAGHVRFANTINATSNLTINGIYIATLEPNSNMAYLALAVGSYEVAIRQSGAETPMIQSTLEISENDWTTAILIGSAEAAELMINDDDLSAPPSGEIRMQVINLRDDAVNMLLNGEIVLEGLAPNADASVSMLTETQSFELLGLEGSIFYYEDFLVLPENPFSIYTVIISDVGMIMFSACAVQ